MNKYNELGNVYLEKAKIVSMKGCGQNSDISGKLGIAMEAAKQVRDSEDLASLAPLIKEVDIVNRAEKQGCQLYEGE